MLHNEDIKLDWDFKLSLLTDLVRVSIICRIIISSWSSGSSGGCPSAMFRYDGLYVLRVVSWVKSLG